MSDQVNAWNVPTFHELPQYNPASNPLRRTGCPSSPLSKGRFVKFPTSLDVDGQPGFPLDVVPGLEGFRLVPSETDGAQHFVLRRPNGLLGGPPIEKDTFRVRIGKKLKRYSVKALFASSLLKEDVTGDEFTIFLLEDGIIVESAADRVALYRELKKKCRKMPRVDLTIIQDESGPIDVTGKGYYLEGGVLFQNGKKVPASRDGTVMLSYN